MKVPFGKLESVATSKVLVFAQADGDDRYATLQAALLRNSRGRLRRYLTLCWSKGGGEERAFFLSSEVFLGPGQQGSEARQSKSGSKKKLRGRLSARKIQTSFTCDCVVHFSPKTVWAESSDEKVNKISFNFSWWALCVSLVPTFLVAPFRTTLLPPSLAFTCIRSSLPTAEADLRLLPLLWRKKRKRKRKSSSSADGKTAFSTVYHTVHTCCHGPGGAREIAQNFLRDGIAIEIDFSLHSRLNEFCLLM